MKKLRLSVFFLFFDICCSGLAAGDTTPALAKGAPAAVTPEVVLNGVAATGGSISAFSWLPDSQRVIFSATPTDLRVVCRAGAALRAAESAGTKGRDRSWIAIMNVQTRECSVVHEGANPTPSPDGKQVLFIYGKTESPQLWVSSLEGRNARALTSGAVFNPYAHWTNNDVYYRRAWSPDSQRIAYAMRPQLQTAPTHSQTPESDSTVVVIGGKGDLGSDTEVRVVEVETGASRKLTSGPYFVWDELSWSPDGATLLFDCVTQVDARTDDIRGEIRSVSVSTGEVRTIVKDHGVQMLRALLSPDGKTIAFTMDPNNVYYPDNWNIAMVPTEGGPIRQLTRNLFVGSGPVWSPKGEGVYFRAKKGVFSQIYFAGINGEVRQVTDGPRGSSTPSVSPDGRQLIWTTSDLLSNQQLRLANVDGSNERIIADLSAPAENLKLGQVEAVGWKSRDGVSIAGFLVKPVGFDSSKKYPMIVDLHGGPVGGASLSSSILHSRMEPHMWANKGFVYFLPDYRSSGVYGWDQIEKARERQDANDRDYDDIMSGVDSLVSQGFVDTNRLALVGHSYGAFLTNWIITRSHPFRVAVSYEGYVDTFLMYGTGFRVGGNPAFEWLYNGTPWDVPENYRKNSPLEFLKGVRTPTLLISGDKGMALYNNEFLYTALKKQKVDVKFLLYKGEGHVISTPANRRDLLQQVITWIETHLEPQLVKGSDK
jgi:dipeptidyl aminopeptidase/acylaminoacyl peptidase